MFLVFSNKIILFLNDFCTSNRFWFPKVTRNLQCLIFFSYLYKHIILFGILFLDDENKSENKPQCRYGSTVCKCPISSQTIKYMRRYKCKLNRFFFSKMLVWIPPRCVPSLESIAQV